MNSHLLDSYIEEIKDSLIDKKVNIQRFGFSYSAHSKSLSVEADGIENITLDPDYYDNLEDHLVYANLTWLTPFSNEINKKLEINFDASIDVLPDGSMKHNEVEIAVNAVVFSHLKDKYEILRYAKTLFASLIPFRQYIHRVTFKGHQYKLSQIVFDLKMDGKKTNAIIAKNKSINQQILSQWLQTLDNIIDYNRDRFKFKSHLPVVNGKMVSASFDSTICFRFKKGE